MSETWLCLNVVVSSIGAGVFVYGRRQRRGLAYLVGAGLIGSPYVVDRPLPLLALCGALLALLWLGPRVGIDF